MNKKSVIPTEFMIDESFITGGKFTDDMTLKKRLVQLLEQRAILADEVGKNERNYNRKSRKVLLELLEILDAFERIFNNTDLDMLDDIARNRIESLQTTMQMLEILLENEDVYKIERTIGERFDPETDVVSGIIEDEKHEEGIILNIVEEGYTWKDRVLRSSKVVVTKKAGEK